MTSILTKSVTYFIEESHRDFFLACHVASEGYMLLEKSSPSVKEIAAKLSSASLKTFEAMVCIGWLSDTKDLIENIHTCYKGKAARSSFKLVNNLLSFSATTGEAVEYLNSGLKVINIGSRLQPIKGIALTAGLIKSFIEIITEILHLEDSNQAQSNSNTNVDYLKVARIVIEIVLTALAIVSLYVGFSVLTHVSLVLTAIAICLKVVEWEPKLANPAPVV